MIEAVIHMPYLINSIERNVGFNLHFAGFVLHRFIRYLPIVFISHFNIAKPFFGQLAHLVGLYMACYNQYRIYRAVMFKEEILYILQGGIFNMRKFFAYGHPAIGMLFVSHFAQLKPYITVGFVYVMLLKFFNNHFTLHVEAFFAKAQR